MKETVKLNYGGVEFTVDGDYEHPESDDETGSFNELIVVTAINPADLSVIDVTQILDDMEALEKIEADALEQLDNEYWDDDCDPDIDEEEEDAGDEDIS